MIPHNIRNIQIIPDIIRYQEYYVDMEYGIRNAFADIRNVPTAFFCACCSTTVFDGIIADGNELFQRHFYFSASIVGCSLHTSVFNHQAPS